MHEIGDEVKNRGASLSANKTKPEQKGESKGKTAQAKQREKKSVAERLANTISSRLQPVKAPDGDAKILSDLLKFADEHALPKKQSNVPKRTPVDRLKDYFRNRERYTQEWNKAREILRDQYKDTPEALDRLESFLNATVDYNGDPLHEQKVIVSAILSDIQKDGGMQKIIEREALGAGTVSAQQISERLIADVGAQGADAQIIRDAVTRNLQEMIASRRSANIANIVRNAISRHSNSLTQIAYMPSEQRKAVGQQIATDIISRLNIPQSRIGDISDLIVDEYMNQVVSRAESILKTRFSKKTRINKEFLDKFREYAALGAFDSQYSQQAAGRLFGRDDITIDTVLADELLNAKTEAEVDAAIDAIYNDIAAQVPPMFGDRLNAWRYFAMLGNPRTHIRNVVGNMVMQLPVRASNKLSASLQGAFLKDPAQRTRSLKRAKGAKEFAKADYETMKGILSGESHLSETDEIRRRQKAFLIPDAQLNDGGIRSMPLKLVNNVLLRPIQAGADFSSRNLDAEDAFFKKMTYINSLADFLSARGVDLNNVPADVLEQGRTHAIEDAKKATFQDASALADAIGRIENKNKATKLVIGGLVPFKRTPINIVKRGFEYSPAGLIKGLTADLKKVRNGTMDATEAIDHIAQGLTGTAIAALGYFLASNDLLSASEPENDKEREFGAAQGSQEYALNIGDYSYTIDWAAPAALPLFVGAEFYNALTQKYDGEEQAFKQATESLSRLFEPMINMTMLSGVGSTIRSAQYSNTNPIFAVGENIVQNYAGQVVPTLLGQIARTADDTRRTTYVDKESWVPDSVQKFMQRQQNKIPGVSKKNAPYMDVFGQTDTEPNTALRAFENFLSPGYISRKKENGAIDGLRALYETTGESSALPSRADTSFRVDGEEVKLSQDEYVKFVQQRGKTMQDSLDVLFGSKSYQDMSDADKLAAVQKVFQYATAEAKTGVSAYKMDSDQERARDSGVSPGLWYGYKQQMSAREAAEQEKYTYMPEIIDQIMNEETLDDGKRQKFVQSLVIDGISDKQKDLYAAAKNDVPADVWAKTYYKFREIEETLDGTGSEKNDAKRAYLFADQGLSKEQKSILDEAMIQDALYIPKDVVVDYSSPESFVLTQMSDAAQEKFSRFGMSVQDYAKYYPIASQGGKKKAEVLEELRAAGMSAGEAESFYKTLKSKNGSSSGKSSKGKSSGGGSSGKGKTGPKLPSKPSAPKLRLP